MASLFSFRKGANQLYIRSCIQHVARITTSTQHPNFFSLHEKKKNDRILLSTPNANFTHFMSALATAEEDSTPPSRIRRTKDPITVTPSAADKIKELLSGPNAEGAIGIRLGTKRRGCNGLSYTLNYAFDRSPKEEMIQAHGVVIIIDPMALFSVIGTVMDWEETDMTSEFTFINPNSKGECGCGESFNV